ncbi:hypothetical protein EUX98_g7331 [Antrodiella citrinella]|uniref:Uncharacterized protein n=1 Tax=Antrodiella citrinella TaxID=2447956 RepID=A0A4S4MLT6_9APHY|nr:hypothetical protein EUX98_g7331 [Antrodiella citrinella]
MGNCVSQQDREAQQRYQEIDKQIEEDSRKLKKEYKILLLGAPTAIPVVLVHLLNASCSCTGSGESGKSTIVKQMKIIHQNVYTKDELLKYRTTIYRNAKNIMLAMRKIGVDCENLTNRTNTDRILDYELVASTSFFFSEEMADAVHQLWLDPVIPTIMDHSSDLYLMDSAS